MTISPDCIRSAAGLSGLLAASFLSTAALAQGTPGQADGEPVREAQPSQSVRDVLREEHTLFSDRLTIEPGISYTYSDRSQLALSGFLVLDAIFLGNISVDTVESHTTTFDLNLRYGLTNRLEWELNLPYVYRSSTYQSIGAGGATDRYVEEDITEGGVGDIRSSLYYRVLPESSTRPDVVLNFGVRAPTGKHPYGIGTREIEGSDGNLTVPEELPTGNGVWGVSTGVSVLKTLDPAIVFANLGYTYNFEKKFSDISSDASSDPGRIELGDSIRFGFGTAFALNPRFSLSLSYTHQHAFDSKRTFEGQSKENITGSGATSGAFNLGATYAMSDTTSLVTNVGIGMTDDAPDITLTFRMPFQM
ncbi:transporter [Billgrantia lactosivorans]|uniref:transporter n=1 Tax=Billgrantia lactosivorans TaxID=2185141 RepID=UPI001FE8F835|nr:transporter [Halomonas lactosivorans]